MGVCVLEGGGQVVLGVVADFSMGFPIGSLTHKCGLMFSIRFEKIL